MVPAQDTVESQLLALTRRFDDFQDATVRTQADNQAVQSALTTIVRETREAQHEFMSYFKQNFRQLTGGQPDKPRSSSSASITYADEEQ